MNPNDSTLLQIVNEALDVMFPRDSLLDVSRAIMSGDPTEDQLNVFTACIHDGFDKKNGCMVDVIAEMMELGAPHYALNHAIRTYVRLCDERESGRLGYGV